MEWHSNHWFYLVKIYVDHTIIVCHTAGIQFFIFLLSAMDLIEFFHLIICFPNGRQAGGLCRHHINTYAEIYTQVINAIADKFHHLIFYISIGKDLADNS